MCVWTCDFRGALRFKFSIVNFEIATSEFNGTHHKSAPVASLLGVITNDETGGCDDQRCDGFEMFSQS